MMNSKRQRHGSHSLLLSRPVVVGGLVVAFALVVTTALLSTVATRGVTKANASIARVQSTLISINQLRAALADAEAGQRGFILTGAPDYLQSYEQASVRLQGEIRELRNRLAGNSPQLATLAQLERVATEKLAEMARTIEVRRQGNLGAAINIEDNDRSISAVNELRTHLRELEKREFSELATRSDHASARADLFQDINIGMIGVALGLAVIGASLLLRRMRELERLIPVCAWTHRVRDDDEWLTFEEYLGKHFHLRFTHGISEEAAEKMRADAVELSQAIADARQPLSDSAAPFPAQSATPFPLSSVAPFPYESRPPMGADSTPPLPFGDSTPPIDVRRNGRATAAR